MTSSMLYDEDSYWPATMQLTELLAINPASPLTTKGTIVSILRRTEWPLESNEAAQRLLVVVGRIPTNIFEFSDPQKQAIAIDSVWEKVRDASLTYGMQKRGPFRQMKALLGGGVEGCTKALTACREELSSVFPELAPPEHPEWANVTYAIPMRGTPILPAHSIVIPRGPDAKDENSTVPLHSGSRQAPTLREYGRQQQRSTLRAGGSAVSVARHHQLAGIIDEHSDTKNVIVPHSPLSSPRVHFVTSDRLPWADLGERPRIPATITSSGTVADVGTQITWISSAPVKVNGHFGDVFSGTRSRVGKVALKRPRIGDAGNRADVMRRFQREAETWARLQHPHILEYLGTFQRDGHYYFVSPFIENGTLAEYIALHPSVNRVKLLCETADAIVYLHQQGIVHGDIKASNLLISDSGQVLLCDFGLTRAIDLRTSTAMKGAGTLRWQSPELWDDGSKSFESDVYAFGMTIAEVLTGEVPFPKLQTDGAVIRAVLTEGKRPPKNPAVSSAGQSYGNVWAVAEACWSAIPEERILMSEALQRIQEDPALAAMQNI